MAGVIRLRWFSVLTVISVGVWVALAVSWIRSYRVSDQFILQIHYNRGGARTFGFVTNHTGRGIVTVEWGQYPLSGGQQQAYEKSPTGLYFVSRRDPVDYPARSSRGGQRSYWGGFGFGHYPSAVLSTHAVFVPHWFLMLLASVLPTRWLMRYEQHRRRIRRGLCLKCGYDLRASSERCPECGTAID
jgi:hypothetical protein